MSYWVCLLLSLLVLSLGLFLWGFYPRKKERFYVIDFELMLNEIKYKGRLRYKHEEERQLDS